MYTTKKQKLLIEFLISSHDLYAIVMPIIDSKYFDPELREPIRFIQKYYQEYNQLPSEYQVNSEIENDLEFTTYEITPDQMQYCVHEIEQFCKRKAIENAILSSPELIEKGDYATVESNIKAAITVSVNRELGLDYFDNPAERIKRMLTEHKRISTGWTLVDDALNGGLLKREMILFAANSGGGKSITMQNLGQNLLESGYDILYVSLELSEDIISQRFDAMITNVPSVLWKDKTTEIINTLNEKREQMGRMVIIQLAAGSNCMMIESYLKEYQLRYNKLPDALIVDYLDILGTNEKISGGVNVSEKDKMTSEQLRNLGVEYNMMIITASQQNRGGINAPDIDMSHIAGGITKINTTDVFISIVLTDDLRNMNQIVFKFLKTRNSDGVGSSVVLGWDSNTLRVTNLKETNITSSLIQRKNKSDSVDVVNDLIERKPRKLVDISSRI